MLREKSLSCDAETGKDRRIGERVRINEGIACRNGNTKRLIIVNQLRPQ